MKSNADAYINSFKKKRTTSSFSKKHECSICLKIGVNEYVTTLQCSHLFHVECIAKWLRENHNTCPMCRHVLYEADAVAVQPPMVRLYPTISTRGSLRLRGRRLV